jgi:hypothetical protein
MSIVDELQKLSELHRSGALNDAEFESAKASALAASSIPPAPAPPIASASVPKRQTSRWGTWILLLTFLLGGAWLSLRQTVGERAATQLVSAMVHAPISIRDEVQSLPASSWKALGLVLPYTGTLSVTVEVTKGNPVDVLLIDEENLERLKSKAQFEQFADFEAVKSRTYRRSTRLNQGMYYLVLRDRTLGILSSSSSDVKVFARLEP